MKTFQFNRQVQNKILAKIQKDKIGIFQVSVLATIVNDDNQLLMVKRSPKLTHAAGRWECVSGRINVGEPPVAALKREVSEEASPDFKVEIIEPYYTFHLIRDDGFEVIGISFYCRYIGGEIKLNEEHTDYRWVSIDTAVNLTQTPGLKKELRYFKRKYLSASAKTTML